MVRWLAALLLVAHPGSTRTQQHPNLSGTWVATKDTPRSLPAAPGAVLGAQFAIRQDDRQVTVTRRVRDTSVTSSYPLGGGEVRTRIPGSLCMADSESVETAAWDGDGLALTIVGTVPPGSTATSKLNIKRVLRLESANRLVVEGSVRDAQGAQRAVGTVYQRSSETMPEAPPPTAPKTPATIAQVAWMSGVWIGASGSDERWTTSMSGSMIGVARTARNNAMTAFEFLCIVERGGGLVYQAMPNGRNPATDFMLTRIESNSVTFENPAHDFPKAIKYTLQADGTLEAVVSGDPKQRALTFTFTRQP